MFEIRANINNIQYIAHQSGVEFTDNKLLSPRVTDAKNSISTLTFDILPNHPIYNSISEYGTLVTVQNTAKNKEVFDGRILQITPVMEQNGTTYKSVVCESALGYLQDSIQPYTEERAYTGDGDLNGLQEFIQLLLTNHNVQTESYKHIYLGNVTVQPFDTSEDVYKGLNYETTWDAFKSKVLDVYGGEIALRKSNGVYYLDYKPRIGTTRSTTITFAKNMLSSSSTPQVGQIVTRLIPLGAKLIRTVTDTDEQGNITTREEETEERLTIASVNDGLTYIEDSTAEQAYGIIYKTQIWDDVTVAGNLLTKGQAWLAENNIIPVNHSVSALDLSLIGVDVDGFNLYDSYPTYNPLTGLNATLEIVKTVTDINEPYNSSFDLGESTQTQSDIILNDVVTSQELSTAVSTVNTRVTNGDNSMRQYVDVSTSSSFAQLDTLIAAEVAKKTISIDEYNTFTNVVKTVLNMNEQGVSLLFQEINSRLSAAEGDISTNQEEILKFIRFENGIIYIGESESPIQIRIGEGTAENKAINFYLGGLLKGSWKLENFYTQNIKVEVGGKAIFGVFGLVPRSDDSLMMLKVGG